MNYNNRLKFFLVFIFVLLFSCNQQKDKSQESSTNFRLITYNIWYGFTKVPDRKDRFVEWIQEQKPDIISLQELNEYTHEKLAEDAAKWGHPYSVLLKEEGFPTGVTSKYPIEDVHRFMDGFHHGLLRVKIRDIFIYIIHLHPSNWETRNGEVDFILADIQKLSQNSSVILAGDFNTFSPNDSVFYTFGKLEPFFSARDEEYSEANLRNGKLDYSVINKLHEIGLIDLEYKMRPTDYHFTGSFPTRIEKEGDHGDLRRLDYVFVNKNLINQVKRAEIIADEITLKLSDHLPIVVDFEIK